MYVFLINKGIDYRLALNKFGRKGSWKIMKTINVLPLKVLLHVVRMCLPATSAKCFNEIGAYIHKSKYDVEIACTYLCLCTIWSCVCIMSIHYAITLAVYNGKRSSFPGARFACSLAIVTIINYYIMSSWIQWSLP